MFNDAILAAAKAAAGQFHNSEDNVKLPESLKEFKGEVAAMLEDKEIVLMLKLRHSMQTARNTALEFMTQKYKIEAHTLLTQKDISESNLSSADKLMMSDLKSVYDATSTPHREDIRNITEKRYGLVLDGNAENDLYNYLDNRINYPEKILPKKDLPRRSPSRESIS